MPQWIPALASFACQRLSQHLQELKRQPSMPELKFLNTPSVILFLDQTFSFHLNFEIH